VGSVNVKKCFLLYLGENHRDRGVFQVKTAEKIEKKLKMSLTFFSAMIY